MVQVSRQQNVTIVEAEGNYPSLAVERLEEMGRVLLGEATRAEPPLLILDLAATGFVGSSFIELMIRAMKRVRERGGAFALCQVQPFCLDILKTARLDQVFLRYATRDEAIAAMTLGVATSDR